VLKFVQKYLFLGTLVLAFLGGMEDGFAQGNSRERLFTVSGIEVDESAASAREARTIALAKAEEVAFQTLLQRLTRDYDLARFVLPEGARAADYVRGIEVNDERNSRIRYIATITITFDEAKIEELLGGQNIAYVSFAPKLTLVFPLLWQDGAWLLWQEDNAFRELWTEEVLQNRIMAYQLPRGDLAERTGITPDILISGRQKDRLKALGADYGAEEILVVAARLDRGTYGDTIGIALELIYPLGGLDRAIIETALRFPESDSELMTRAIEQMLNDQDAAWKAKSLTQFGSVTELMVIIPAEDTDSWADALARLRATAVVQDIEIKRMAMPVSYVVIKFIGSQEQLALALAQKGLILLESAEGWVVLREETQGLFVNGG